MQSSSHTDPASSDQPSGVEEVVEQVASALHVPLERREIPFWRVAFTYSLGNLGTGIYFAFSNFVLPLFLSGLLAPPWLIGLLSSTRSFEGAIIQPVIGTWSDHTWTRLGRRRPFIVRFLPVSVLFLILTPFIAQIPSLPGMGLMTSRLVAVGISVFLFTVTFNIMYDPYLALMPDIISPQLRGKVNGLAQLLLLVGQMALPLGGLLLIPAFGLTPLFILVAVALLLSFWPVVRGIKERRDLAGHPQAESDEMRLAWQAVTHNRSLALYFLAQFFMWSGINAVTPYLTLYATGAAGLSTQSALGLVLASQVMSALLVYPLGLLSDRVGARRVLFGGIACLALAALAGVLTTNPLALLGILLVAGIGNAAQMVSSYPLLTHMVPAQRMGLFTGLNSTVTSIAAPLGTLLVGLLIGAYGYRAMFPFVAVMFLAALVPLGMLRVHAPWTQRRKVKVPAL